MSTIAAQNYGDGSSSVPAGAIIEGTAKLLLVYDHTVPSISRNYNVSSVTDNSTGQATINITNNFDAVDYSPFGHNWNTGSAGFGTTYHNSNTTGATTTSAFGYTHYNNAVSDGDYEGYEIKGDLA